MRCGERYCDIILFGVFWIRRFTVVIKDMVWLRFYQNIHLKFSNVAVNYLSLESGPQKANRNLHSIFFLGKLNDYFLLIHLGKAA